MSAIPISGGTYESTLHEYRDSAGNWTPSLTQILLLSGIANHYNGDRDVIENAQRRGSEVHALAAMYAKYGEVDPTWESEETKPYFDAYMSFLQGSGFVPDADFVEQPMIAELNGMKYGVTADVIGSRKHPTIVELKTSEAAQPWWAIQLSGQAVARFGQHRGLAVQRWAVQLKRNGKHVVNVYEKHAYDLQVFSSALTTVHWRLAHGQKLWERE